MAQANITKFSRVPAKETKNRLERLIMIPAISLLALIIPSTATLFTDMVWPLASVVDPEKVFVWVTIHHV